MDMLLLLGAGGRTLGLHSSDSVNNDSLLFDLDSLGTVKIN